VASSSDCARERVAEWERGAVGLNLAKLEKIAAVMGYKIAVKFLPR
jgi:transcriptional regulator with XRE-family HTH domain